MAYAVDGAQLITNYLNAHAAKNTFFYFTDGLLDTAFISQKDINENELLRLASRRWLIMSGRS